VIAVIDNYLLMLGHREQIDGMQISVYGDPLQYLRWGDTVELSRRANAG